MTGGCSGNKPYYIIVNNRYDDSIKNEDKFSFANLLQSTEKQSQTRHLLLVFKYNLSKREPSISTIEIGNLKKFWTSNRSKLHTIKIWLKKRGIDLKKIKIGGSTCKSKGALSKCKRVFDRNRVKTCSFDRFWWSKFPISTTYDDRKFK